MKKEELPWSWKPIKTDAVRGVVDALIESVDGLSKLKLVNVDPNLANDITGLLISSYKWGRTTASVDSSTKTEAVDSNEVQRLRQEIEELKTQKVKDSQAIGGLKGQLTKLKAKLESKAGTDNKEG
jgi:hypothetical protein